MACAAAAYTAQCTWPGHAGGGGECSASKQGTCSSARAARGEVPDHAWIACEAARGLVSPAERRVGQSSVEKGAGAAGGSRKRARVDGRSYVHAEGSGATLQARGQLAGTRGLHKAAVLASYSPNCTF